MTKGSKAEKGERNARSTASELDRAWGQLTVDMTSAAYRDRQPTPHDEDPLRHFENPSEKTEHTRDKLPTLPEINPLRYDIDP